jgi:GNAT superfamily N-acetyltransferase
MTLKENDEIMFRLANLQEVEKITTLNHIEWGNSLTIKEYMERERVLKNTTMGQKYLKPFALINTVNNDELISFLEVYERSSYIKYPNNDNSIKIIKSWSIASVFTPLQHRNKGYGSLLIKKLIETMKNELIQSSVLYSDIGIEFYARFGYHPRDAFNGKIIIDSITNSYINDQLPSNILIIDQENVIKYIENYNEKQLLRMKQTQEKITFFTPLSKEILDWLTIRANFYKSALKRKGVSYYGIQVENVWCLFFFEYKKNDLHLLILDDDQIDQEKQMDQENTKKLFKYLNIIALNCEMKSIQFYNPLQYKYFQNHPNLLQELGIKIEKRESEISSLLLIENNQVMPLQKLAENVEWYGDHKYFWV